MKYEMNENNKILYLLITMLKVKVPKRQPWNNIYKLICNYGEAKDMIKTD